MFQVYGKYVQARNGLDWQRVQRWLNKEFRDWKFFSKFFFSFLRQICIKVNEISQQCKLWKACWLDGNIGLIYTHKTAQIQQKRLHVQDTKRKLRGVKISEAIDSIDFFIFLPGCLENNLFERRLHKRFVEKSIGCQLFPDWHKNKRFFLSFQYDCKITGELRGSASKVRHAERRIL